MGIFGTLKEKFIGDEIEDEDVEGLEPLDGYEDNMDAASGEVMGLNGAIELKVVKPERYGNVKQIADHLLNKRTIVLNLESTNKETAKRLLDFLSGVAYSIDGQLKRVATNTFVITPSNVDVSGEQMRAVAGEETSSYTTTFGVASDAAPANNSDSLY